MRVLVTIGDRVFGTTNAFAQWVRSMLNVIVIVDRAELERRLVPPLYKSGVRFAAEPAGQESFVDALTCYAQGFGDCAHLACWRLAELQNGGERADLSIKWRYPQYHVRVRRADGRLEDPSRMLGMPVSAMNGGS